MYVGFTEQQKLKLLKDLKSQVEALSTQQRITLSIGVPEHVKIAQSYIAKQLLNQFKLQIRPSDKKDKPIVVTAEQQVALFSLQKIKKFGLTELKHIQVKNHLLHQEKNQRTNRELVLLAMSQILRPHYS
jgi:hypothetical protein